MRFIFKVTKMNANCSVALFAALFTSCIPKFSQKPSTSDVDFAARGKDNTLLLTPVRLPAFTQVDDNVDKSRGYACAFKTAKNAVNSSFAAMSDEALAKLSDPRPYKDKLEVVTPFPVPAASAIQILMTQTAQTRMRQLRAEAAARAGAEADKQEGDFAAATGAAGAAGTGGVILQQAMSADDLSIFARSGANMSSNQHAFLQEALETAANVSILSDLIDPDRYRSRYNYIPNFNPQTFAESVRSRIPTDINPSPFANVPTSRQALETQMKIQTTAAEKLRFMAQNHKNYETFATEFARVSNELGIKIRFNPNLISATETEKILEMSGAAEALESTLKSQHESVVQALRAAGFMPKSSKFWDEFVFRLDKIAKSPWGHVKIATAAAAFAGVVVGGGFLIKRALSLPNLEGMVKLTDEEIGLAEQQLLKLGMDYPVTKSTTCKQALGL